MPVSHAFVSGIADDPNHPEEVRPSNWNAGHVTNIDLATEVTGILGASHLPSLSGTYIAVDGTSTTTSSIPFAQGWSISSTKIGYVGGISDATARLKIYDDTSTAYITGLADSSQTNGAKVIISAGDAQSLDSGNGGMLYLKGGNPSGDGITRGFTATGTSITSFAASNNMGGATAGNTINDFAVGTGGNFYASTGAIFANGIGTGGKLCPSGYSLFGTGESAQIIGIDRKTSGAGQNLTIQAGWAQSGASNTNAGSLILAPGKATGTGTGTVQIQAAGGGSTGTTDQPPTTVCTFNYNNITTPFQIISTLASGTKPIDVTSTTLCNNLNAEFWNSQPFKATGSPAQGHIMAYVGSSTNAWQNFANPAGKGNFYLSNSSAGVLAWTIFPTTATPIWSTVLTAGRTSSGVNPQLTTTDHLEFRDANKYIYSDASTSLTMVSDGNITFTPGASSKIFLGANSAYDQANKILGIGATSSLLGALHCQIGSTSLAGFAFTGTATDGSVDNTAGVGGYLTHNAGGNRQFVFADTASGTGVRFLANSIDAVTSYGNVRADLQIGNDTNGATVGQGTISGAGIAFGVLTSVATRVGIAIRGFASQSADLLHLEDSSANVLTAWSSAGKVNRYNNVATTGYGHAAIYSSGRVTAQTAAVASIATYTVGAADGSFLVSANVLITTSTLHSFTATVTYTDEGSTSRTVTLNFSTIAGALTPTIANAGGAAPYEGVPLHIRAKASTAITIATTGTFTTVTYNAEGSISQIA